MEKQLGWASKLGRTESLGISKVGQTVLASDEILDLAPDCQLFVGKTQKMDNGLCVA